MTAYTSINIQNYDILHKHISWVDESFDAIMKTQKWIKHFIVAVLAAFLLIGLFIVTVIGARLFFQFILRIIIPKISLQIADIPFDKNTYLKYRQLYNEIDKDISKLTKVQQIFQQEIPSIFLLNGVKRDASKILSILFNWHKEIEKALKSMNFPENIDTKPFEAVTEEELWNNRNHAYKYLI
jgi:hypothetical protein